MPRPARRAATCLLLALASCSSAAPRQDFGRMLHDAPGNTTARLLVDGDRIVRWAVPNEGPGSMPAAVRTMLSAVAPDGETLFQGREWGPDGAGYRVDKRYRDGRSEHRRSVLIAEDGTVIERSHTVPLAEVPQQVLATGLRTGPHVDEAQIVSDGERERCWSLLVRDRTGSVFVVTVGLDGRDLGRRRRLAAIVDG